MKLKKHKTFKHDGAKTTCVISWVLVDDNGRHLTDDVTIASTTCAKEDTYNEKLGEDIAASKAEKKILKIVNRDLREIIYSLDKTIGSFENGLAKYTKAQDKEEVFYNKLVKNETGN